MEQQRQIVLVSLFLIAGVGLFATTIVSLRRPRKCKVPGTGIGAFAETPPQVVVARQNRYFTRSKATQRPVEPKVVVITNSGRGDCMFICFRQALYSLDKKVFVTQLRKAVADSISQETLETLKVIHESAKQEGDYELMKDYGFMNDVGDLRSLKQRIMSRTYYGDDMALPALERYTGLNAIVIKDDKIQKRVEDPVPGNPFIVLHLRNEHYQLVSYGGCTVFQRYPTNLIDLLTK